MAGDHMTTPLIQDAEARQQALEINSFIVEAPAGAGKTELLTQRFLRLLAVVENPEEVMALTFTNKASTEMRDRILGSLERSAAGIVPSEPHKRKTFDLAQDVLKRDAARHWNLLGHPGRLRITTLDALCANLARQMPYLSRFGCQPPVCAEPDIHYATAAQRTLEMVDDGTADADVVAQALSFMDNHAGRLESLLVSMLGRRDQWVHHASRIESGALRPEVEAGFAALIERDLVRVADLLDAGAPVVTEASIAKIVATENNFKCADIGMQIMGGAGYSNEYDMQMFFRDSRVGPIGGGTSEIQRNIIAKQLAL